MFTNLSAPVAADVTQSTILSCQYIHHAISSVYTDEVDGRSRRCNKLHNLVCELCHGAEAGLCASVDSSDEVASQLISA